jgi:Tol biopolymer transport system component
MKIWAGTAALAAAASMMLTTPADAGSVDAAPIKNGNLLYNGWSYNEAPDDWEALFFHAPRAEAPSTTWSDFPDYYVMSARFSADGTQVANVFTKQSETNGDPWVRIRDVATGVTTSLIPLSGYAPVDGLDWSPDGTRLVTTTSRSMVIVDIATGDATTILTRPTELQRPAWSPDGTRIAYNDGSTIRLIRPDGTGRRIFASTPGSFDLAPTWSPDSRTIAFRTGRFGDDELVSLPRSGAGAPVRISRLNGQPDPSYWFVDLDWSPDGKKIAALELQDIDGLDWTRIRAYNVDGSGKYWLTPRLDADGLTGTVDWGPLVR